MRVCVSIFVRDFDSIQMKIDLLAIFYFQNKNVDNDDELFYTLHTRGIHLTCEYTQTYL